MPTEVTTFTEKHDSRKQDLYYLKLQVLQLYYFKAASGPAVHRRSERRRAPLLLGWVSLYVYHVIESICRYSNTCHQTL